MPIYMAIDYGLERTGLAISDPDGKLVFPLATLRLSQHRTRACMFDALADLARKNGAQELVIGLPLYTDGNESLMARQTRKAATRILHRLPLPLHWMPEILSSEEARQDLQACGLSGKSLKDALDQQAACRILGSFLSQPEHLRMPA